MGNNDVLRELAKQYAEIANSDQNHLNIIFHRKVNDLKPSRPALLIDEIPWQEMNIENELTLVSDDPVLQTVEQYMRQTIYKWNHMRADMVVPPYIGVQKIIHSTGIGITPKHDGAYHETHGDVQNVQYVNQLNTEEDLEKLHNEIITWDETETRKRFEQIAETIGDIIPVKITGEPTGYLLGCKTWDDICTYRGVNTLFYDLIDRPEFMHALVGKLTNIFLDKIRQYEELNLFDGDSYALQGTAALTNDLHPEQDHVKANQVWGRGLAQILASVSPSMHEEFDIDYMKKAMAPFGLVYYGCCEPLHNKIDILRQIPHLRKISISPWANIDIAAEAVSGDYVIAAKASPSKLAVTNLDESSIRDELRHIINACRHNNCNFDIALKDITTVCGRPQNLFRWEQIASEVVREFDWM